MTTPILIIAYRRYGNVLMMMRNLNENNCGKIYLAVDGLEHQDNGERQTFINDVTILSESLSLEVEVWIRERNLGAAVSVVTAIDWLFSKEASGLILEDDLVIGADTLRYFESALRYYEADPKVHLISGSNYWAKRFIGAEHPWSSYPITWGWATWGDRWMELRKCYFSTGAHTHKYSSLSEIMFWRTGIERCKSGKQDAWDIPLAAFSKGKDGISILPPVNLVSNIGVDAHAGNTRENIWPLNQTIESMPEDYEFTPVSNLMPIECLDESIRRELYRISLRNIASGMLRLVLGKISSPPESRQLGLRINSVVLPSLK